MSLLVSVLVRPVSTRLAALAAAVEENNEERRSSVCASLGLGNSCMWFETSADGQVEGRVACAWFRSIGPRAGHVDSWHLADGPHSFKIEHTGSDDLMVVAAEDNGSVERRLARGACHGSRRLGLGLPYARRT